MRRRPTIQFYTRAQCHLCEIAKQELEQLRTSLGFNLEVLDVDDDPESQLRYGEQVPVGLIDGRKIFKYRVDHQALRRAIRSRGDDVRPP